MVTRTVNAWLDRLARPRLPVGPTTVSSFWVCGCIGLTCAVALAMLLAWRLGLSPLVIAGLAALAWLTFLALAVAARLLTDAERLVAYEHVGAIFGVLTVALVWTGQPILDYLDPVSVGVAVFLVWGRLGCLMVGCCYGRPARVGISYTRAHAAEGLPAYLVGTRLFPVQIVEGAWMVGVIATATGARLAGAQAGTVLLICVAGYAVARFCLELLRGDPRQRWRGLTAAQWLALATLSGLSLLAWSVIPLAVAVVLLGVRQLGSTAERDASGLLGPAHMAEVAAFIERFRPSATDGAGSIHVLTTAHGMRVSASTTQVAESRVGHVALSARRGALGADTVQAFARLVAASQDERARCELLRGNDDVHHVLIFQDR